VSVVIVIYLVSSVPKHVRLVKSLSDPAGTDESPAHRLGLHHRRGE